MRRLLWTLLYPVGLLVFIGAVLADEPLVAAGAFSIAIVVPGAYSVFMRLRTGQWPYEPAPTRTAFIRRGHRAMQRGDDLFEVHRSPRRREGHDRRTYTDDE